MKIIKRRERIEHVTRELFFERKDCPGAGFSFPCDEKGNVNVAALPAAAQSSYSEALRAAGGPQMYAPEVREYTSVAVEPALGLCNRCGDEVALYGFTNTCDCGADYNMSGQELAPRSQWGEETGESVADILAVDYGKDEW
jgi:hypothetical protein